MRYTNCALTFMCIREHFQDSLFPSPLSSYFNVEASPEDMAEYIFFTKDDRSVTQAIEKLIQDGRVSMNRCKYYCNLSETGCRWS